MGQIGGRLRTAFPFYGSANPSSSTGRVFCEPDFFVEGVLQASGPAITVRLAVDRDRSDAARRVEAIRTQHAAKLVANPLFS